MIMMMIMTMMLIMLTRPAVVLTTSSFWNYRYGHDHDYGDDHGDDHGDHGDHADKACWGVHRHLLIKRNVFLFKNFHQEIYRKSLGKWIPLLVLDIVIYINIFLHFQYLLEFNS